jgi:hypothetical protein
MRFEWPTRVAIVCPVPVATIAMLPRPLVLAMARRVAFGLKRIGPPELPIVSLSRRRAAPAAVIFQVIRRFGQRSTTATSFPSSLTA